MDKKLKSKWIKALRSGKYQQGNMVLKSGGKYCCLGVLREVANPEDTEEVEQGCGTVLTKRQRERFGLSVEEQGKLTGMNDGWSADGDKEIQKRGFKAISNWIEKNL